MLLNRALNVWTTQAMRHFLFFCHVLWNSNYYWLIRVLKARKKIKYKTFPWNQVERWWMHRLSEFRLCRAFSLQSSFKYRFSWNIKPYSITGRHTERKHAPNVSIIIFIIEDNSKLFNDFSNENEKKIQQRKLFSHQILFWDWIILWMNNIIK